MMEEYSADYSAFKRLRIFFAKGYFSGMEFRAAVKNLFNKDYEAPTSSSSAYQLPDDLPMPGTNFFLELGYTF
ncbi:MAG: TonB-dependent receptor [Nitrospina sp.]|jgi:outer membrane receptor protein involved in Fe transport|nr:TonB-dependent receptor [Nitrospina sp.]